MTMRWTTLSMLLPDDDRLPCVMGAGFGLNDWSLLCPMMLTVAAPPGADGVGIDAVMLDDDPPLPHPHAARTKTRDGYLGIACRRRLRKSNAAARAREFARSGGDSELRAYGSRTDLRM